MSETQATAPRTRTKTADQTSITEDLIARVIEATEQRLATRPNPMNLNTFEEIEAFAERASRSKMVPKDFQGKPEDIILAVMQGKELGLPPIQAIQSIAMVNGRPSVWGDAVPGLCYARGLVEDHQETYEGQEGTDGFTAICVVKRKGVASPKIGRFSQQDAKRAGLYGQGVHGKYPRRMMQWRARHAAFHDAFPDVLRGIGTREIEAEDSVSTPGWSMPQPEKGWFTVKATKQTDGWDDTWFRGVVQKLASETNAWRWLDLLVACLGDAPTLRDVNEISDLPVVLTVREAAPDDGKKAIDEAFATARAKFNESPVRAEDAVHSVAAPGPEGGTDPAPSGPSAQPVPAETPNPAEAPAAEGGSTQSPTSAGLAFSVWLVDGEGNELPDSDGVFEPFDDPVKFACAYKDAEGSLFPADIELFQRANEDNVQWACNLSQEAAAIFTPPAPLQDNVNPPLPMAMPVDPWFIPPPTKSTRAEFSSYEERFKKLLAEAANDQAIDHLVMVNSPVTERSDFLNSTRLKIKAATEDKRKDLMRPAQAENHEATSRAEKLMLRVKACKTRAEAEALVKDVDLIADIRWLHANAPEIRKSTAVAMDEFVKGLPG